MGPNHNKVRRMVKEDRLSSLPNELIHKIMSCVDMKFVVQMCLLSSRWKLLWTSMPYLNFSTYRFLTFCKFAKFVTHVLSHRNHQTQVSSVTLFVHGSVSHEVFVREIANYAFSYNVQELTHVLSHRIHQTRVSYLKLVFHGVPNQVFVRKIANYAFSHNVQELAVSNSSRSHFASYPPVLFSSQSLKIFKLICSGMVDTLRTPWDFPVLTTLHLGGMVLCGELFSKCVNLKNLTLDSFSVNDWKVFDIITPRLSNLILMNGKCSRVINLIAPQLENLTIECCSIKHLNVPPGLLSLSYWDLRHPPFSEDRFHSLHTVTICLYLYGPTNSYKEEDARKIINMLQQLYSARYLTLNAQIIRCISSFPDLLSQNPSALCNLISLTIINYPTRKDQHNVKMLNEAKNFLLENSPSASLIMTST